MTHEKSIYIKGARVHNLKNVDLEIPRRKLVVITGLSGSGKSTLAFDTDLRRGAAPLRGEPVGLRPAVSGQDRQARRRPHHGDRAGHRHRTEGQHAQSAFDGRHHHRDLRLPQTALRPHRPHLLARIGTGGALLQRGRRGDIHSGTGRGEPRRHRCAARAGRRAGSSKN